MTRADDELAHDPRTEAEARLGAVWRARVLEPSPPYDDSDPAYLADDPVALAGEDRASVVSPVSPDGPTWDDLVEADEDLADFAADRWLCRGRSIATDLPDGYHAGRLALHRLAVYVLSPARIDAIAKMALRRTHHGFGTPFFGADDRQVRVEDLHLIDQRAGRAGRFPLTTLAQAAEDVGVTIDPSKADAFDVPPAGDVRADLAIAPAVASFVADWFGFATRVLEIVRAEVPSSDRPSRVQLWPEHFDPAFEAGDEGAGRRAGFGASPGDHHDEGDHAPYLYVSVWAMDQVPEDPFWNVGFGAKLPFAQLAASGNPEEAALAFYRHGHQLLTGV